MRVTLRGTRGSLSSPGPDTVRYGGNTSCVEVIGDEGTALVLDAGTGIRQLSGLLPRNLKRVDILLTHLHMDHIQGLGFFGPLHNPAMEVHIWGPASATQNLHARLKRYMSPPLFPVRVTDLACKPIFHEVPCDDVDIGEFRVATALVCHPGPTVGYRVTSPKGRVLTYLPDHEPALGVLRFPSLPRQWTSGAILAENSDLLIHDSQYTNAEYATRFGWGHSTVEHVLEFAKLAEVHKLVPFHHDPEHSDVILDQLFDEAIQKANPPYQVIPGFEGATFEV